MLLTLQMIARRRVWTVGRRRRSSPCTRPFAGRESFHGGGADGRATETLSVGRMTRGHAGMTTRGSRPKVAGQEATWRTCVQHGSQRGEAGEQVMQRDDGGGLGASHRTGAAGARAAGDRSGGRGRERGGQDRTGAAGGRVWRRTGREAGAGCFVSDGRDYGPRARSTGSHIVTLPPRRQNSEWYRRPRRPAPRPLLPLPPTSAHARPARDQRSSPSAISAPPRRPRALLFTSRHLPSLPQPLQPRPSPSPRHPSPRE